MFRATVPAYAGDVRSRPLQDFPTSGASVTSPYATAMKTSTGTSVNASTAAPPRSAPSGIPAVTPVVSAPSTRARIARGSCSYSAVSSSGLIEPASSPENAKTLNSTGTGTSSAMARYGGGPHSTKQTTRVARRGSLWPNQPNSPEPASAPKAKQATMTPKISPSGVMVFAYTGFSTSMPAASKQLVITTMRTTLRMIGVRAT